MIFAADMTVDACCWAAGARDHEGQHPLLLLLVVMPMLQHLLLL